LLLAAWLRGVTTPLVVALAIAYILDPLVVRLEGMGLKRWIGVSLVYAAFLLAMALILAAVIPPALRQVSRFPAWVEARFPEVQLPRPGDAEPQGDAPAPAAETNGVAPADTALERAGEQSGGPGGDLLDAAVEVARRNAGKIAARLLAFARDTFQHVTAMLTGAVGALLRVGLVFVYTFFFLLGLARFKETVQSHLPGRYRPEILRIVGRLDAAYSAFFRGRALICLCSGVLTSIGLWICGIPFWLLLGMGVGVLGVIPFIGVLLGLIPALGLAIAIGGWHTALGVAVVFAIVQCIEPLLTPIIISRGVKLHPITVLVAGDHRRAPGVDGQDTGRRVPAPPAA